MLIYILLLLVGFGLLIYGADVFVGGSVDIARRFGVPSLVIGLTIVAIGTSAPEVIISTMASVRGFSEMAVGNVIGSNIFNMMFILGVCGIIYPFKLQLSGISRDLWMCAISTLAFLGIVISGQSHLTRMSSVLFVTAFLIYIATVTIKGLESKGLESKGLKSPSQEGPKQEDHKHEKPKREDLNIAKALVKLVAGLVILILGGQLVVENATQVASAIGMTERVISITIVAAGTSLPELVTCLIACKKGKSDIALGNIVGSSVLNILFVLGIAGTISPIPISPGILYDLVALMLATTLSIIAIISRQRISRPESVVLVVAYVVYTVSLF